MTDSARQVWLGGELVETSAAYDRLRRAMYYGDGLFATLRVRDGRLLDADRHADRLLRGAAAIGLPAPRGCTDRAAVVRRLVSGAQALGAGTAGDGVLRCQWSSAGGGRGYGRDGASIDLVEWSAPPPPRSLTVGVLGSDAVPPATIPHVKSCNALPHVVAAEQARRLGCHEVLRVHDGSLAEGVASNLFFERDGRLFTPGIGLPLYPGVIRERVLEEALRLGIRVTEGRFGTDALDTCDGVFLTGSVRGLESVATLDGRRLDSAPLFEALEGAVGRARASEGVPIPGAAT